MSWFDIVLAVSGLPVLAASLYLAALAVMARREASRIHLMPRVRFDVIVPAHDEESGIARTVESLLAIDYPRSLFRVLVVADNCGDSTGECAAAAGAQVLVREDAYHQGKGHALAYAFNWRLADGFSDAVVVVDADSVVSSNILSEFAARFEAGALAVQANYGVLNPRSSWRTRLMTIALAAFHDVRSLSRERLGLSCGLRGNGMGFSRALLVAQPYEAFSIVEDLEYGLQLGYAGIRVQYVPEASVLGQMVATERASRSQRRRWELGRWTLARQHVPRLIKGACVRRDPLTFDLALDLLVPPLGHLVALNAVGAVICITAWSTVGIASWIWGISAFGVLVYVLRAWALSGVGPSALLDLAWAPVYVIWKLTLSLRGTNQTREDSRKWIRTTREF
jgi:1,2-diacylglycerol 3-beta-glucosyltransferase